MNDKSSAETKQTRKGQCNESLSVPSSDVVGDSIVAHIGEGGSNVVVGKNIRIGYLNIPRWLLYISGVSCVVILLFATFQVPTIAKLVRTHTPIVKCLFPLPMDDSQFNVVMTPFTELNRGGRVVRSTNGEKLAEILYNRYLQPGFDQLHESGLTGVLRSPQHSCAVNGKTDEEQMQHAEEFAESVAASVVIFGSLQEDENGIYFTPRFYVGYKGFEEAAEITGPLRLGTPIFVPLPLNVQEFQGVEDHQLNVRMKALSWTILGLAAYANDNFEQAIFYFEQAEQSPGWLDRHGKEIIFLLLGNAYARWAGQEQQSEYLSAASEYYDRALEIAPSFVRVLVGKAGLLYQQALGDLARLSIDEIDLVQLEQAEQMYLQALQTPSSAEISLDVINAKSRLGLAQIHIVRYYRLGDSQSLMLAQTELEKIVESYGDGGLRVSDLAGHTYARLGLIAQLLGDNNQAISHYQHAIELVSLFWQARYLLNVANIYTTEGDLTLAQEFCQMAMLRAESLGDESLVQTVETNCNK